MIRRRRTTITREGWYYLTVLAFVIVAAMMREINLLMVMAGMMFGPLLLSWRLAVSALRPLSVSRRAPTDVCAGDLLVVDITVQSRAARFPRLSLGGWGVEIEDSIRSLAAAGPKERFDTGVLLWRIQRGQTQRVNYRGRLLRRGRYQLGPLTVSTCFPLGLVRRTVIVDSRREVTVLPARGRLTAAWERLYRQALCGSRGRQAQQTVLEGEFHSLREWRSGDARRRIHWRTTARRRAPVVRQFEHQRSRDLVLLLDLWVPRGRGGGNGDAVERAVSFAATVVSDLCGRGGGHLVLGIAGQTMSTSRGAASPALLPGCLVELAEAEPGDGRHFEPLLKEACLRMRPGASLIVVSTRTSRIADAEQLRQLRDHPRQRGVDGALLLDAEGDGLAEYFSLAEAPVTERKS